MLLTFLVLPVLSETDDSVAEPHVKLSHYSAAVARHKVTVKQQHGVLSCSLTEGTGELSSPVWLISKQSADMMVCLR